MKVSVPFYFKIILFLSFILSCWQGVSQTSPTCTALSNINPSGDVDVPLDVNFIWPASERVVSYSLIVGTSPDGTDILDNVNVGNVTEYDLPDYLPAGQTIHVRVVSINAFGQNPGCWETIFTTTPNEIVECSFLTLPIPNSIDNPTDTAIEWTTATNATGYRITVGSFAGGNDLVDDLDIGNNTSYQHPGGFIFFDTIFVTVTPYDDFGGNTTCQEFRFDITSGVPPLCSIISVPEDGGVMVPVNSDIVWIQDVTATGYLLTIRENTIDGPFVLQNEDVGNQSSYNPPNFEPNTRYYVTVVPYNSQGEAVGCQTINFTSGDPLPLPNCANWVFPVNGATNVSTSVNLEWEPVPDIDGFILSVGTSENGTDIINMQDLGNVVGFELPSDLPEGTTIYVTLNTYNGELISESCPVISFTIVSDADDLRNEIPKFFSPNNDGFNDLWTVSSTDKITVDKIFVFDRYGKLIKQLREGQGWNGRFNGINLPSSSYWYSVELVDGRNINGYFMLKR